MRKSNKEGKKKRITPGERKALMAEVRKLMGQNHSDSEICDKLEIRVDVLNQLKLTIHQADKVRFQNMDRYSVYSDYCSHSQQLLKELEEIRLKFRNRGQWTALVAAVKQKKEIMDSVIKMGQDFGFIERKATEVKVEGEFSFSTMSDEDVKGEIEKEVRKMHQIASGQVVEMRQELLGVTPDDIDTYVPSHLIKQVGPARSKKQTRIKTKMKVTLKKHV